MDTITLDFKKYSFITGIVLGIALIVLALVTAYSQIQSSKALNATITVSGEGDVIAKPDIATVTFTVRENAKTVPEAQKLTEVKVNDGLDAIKSLGVSDSDVKTTSYNVYPKYVYTPTVCPMGSYCPSKQTISGYDVSETIEVKIRKIDQAGDAIGLIGKANITEISGPNFTVDDINKLQDEAKSKAIADAKLKAKNISKDLGVRLGDISAYSENTGGYYPATYASVQSLSTVKDSVSLPQGETSIKSNISITYKINQ